MPGERILSRFTLEQRLGSGGFGTVYRAWDERLQRPVAVKVIESSKDGKRVIREAQAAARLAHPGIVTLYELAHDGSRAFLVTELVEGSTVRELTVSGELSDRELAGVGADAADALAHAHAQGVVHRDIKPQNILVAEKDGEAKLVDFGIARLVDEATMTASGDVLGTLAYMAPEQADGGRPGPPADIYSLALTLYEGWAGEHPLLRGSAAATARAIGEPVASLREHRPDLPAELVEEIDLALDPDPELRPSAERIGGVLQKWARMLNGTPLPRARRRGPRGAPRPRAPTLPTPAARPGRDRGPVHRGDRDRPDDPRAGRARGERFDRRPRARAPAPGPESRLGRDRHLARDDRPRAGRHGGVCGARGRRAGAFRRRHLSRARGTAGSLGLCLSRAG